MITVQSIEDSAPANAFPSTIKANINIFKTELIKYRNGFSQQLGEILPQVIFLKIVSMGKKLQKDFNLVLFRSAESSF